jgi:hypothetical protein
MYSFESVEIEYRKRDIEDNAIMPDMWDFEASRLIRDLMAQHFDNDVQWAMDAQYAAQDWKEQNEWALRDGCGPLEKSELAQDWVDFVKAVSNLKTDLARESQLMPEVQAISFLNRDLDRER